MIVLTLGSIGDGSQGVMIVLIPSLKGWDGSIGVMIVLIPSLKGWDGSIGVMGEQGCGTRVREMNGTAVVSG